MFFFSCLDARKEPKENQGVRDASQLFRIHKGVYAKKYLLLTT